MCILKKIPKDLLASYCNLVCSMSRAHAIPSMYGALDKRRSETHDQILAVTGRTRDDTELAMALAVLTEELVDRVRELEHGLPIHIAIEAAIPKVALFLLEA